MLPLILLLFCEICVLAFEIDSHRIWLLLRLLGTYLVSCQYGCEEFTLNSEVKRRCVFKTLILCLLCNLSAATHSLASKLLSQDVEPFVVGLAWVQIWRRGFAGSDLVTWWWLAHRLRFDGAYGRLVIVGVEMEWWWRRLKVMKWCCGGEDFCIWLTSTTSVLLFGGGLRAE
ncbi:hypothetical protein A2U01_0011164, partial [Trifolium medium]|nr:hypothetical protein [Trifolium medium]